MQCIHGVYKLFLSVFLILHGYPQELSKHVRTFTCCLSISLGSRDTFWLGALVFFKSQMTRTSISCLLIKKKLLQPCALKLLLQCKRSPTRSPLVLYMDRNCAKSVLTTTQRQIRLFQELESAWVSKRASDCAQRSVWAKRAKRSIQISG